MHHFPTSLPTDIVFTIFSYLDQTDCVECMRVCRQWYYEIPSYAIQLWEQLLISPESWQTTNECMLTCLGPQVQKVTLDRLNACSILYKLMKRGCRITMLEIRNHVPLAGDHPSKDAKLLGAIEQFDDTLKGLHIIGYPSYMPPTDLMRRFPKLTHLSLLYDNKVTFPTITDNKALTAINGLHNLVYLHLKIPFGGQIETCIIPVLRLCPQLKCLLVAAASSHTITSTINTTNTIDLDSILDLCPRLQYVMWNMHRVYLRRDEAHLPKWQQISTRTLNSNNSDKGKGGIREANSSNNNKEEGIHGLIFEGHIDDINGVAPILIRSQETLSHLELFNVDMDRSRDWHEILVQNTQFPRLVTLKLTNLEMPREEGWIDLFAGCRNLKCLDVSLGPFDMRWDRIVQGITSSLKRLEHLRLHDNDYRAAPHVDFGDCIRMLSKYSSLRRLDLHNTCISDQNLLDLCEIRSLRELSLQMGLKDNQSLLKFADRLKETNSSLDTLKLISVHNLNDAALIRLAQVESLSLISVFWNSQITDDGVRAFVRGSTTDNTGKMKKKKKAFVDQCPSVSKWGTWTTEELL